MSVYVDELIAYPHIPARLKRYGDKTCHMVADTDAELHAMALQLRIRPYFQPKSYPHYDLTENKRRQAVLLGAREFTMRELTTWLRSSTLDILEGEKTNDSSTRTTKKHLP